MNDYILEIEALVIRFETKKQSTIELELSHEHLISLSFASIFQKSKLGVVDLLSKIKFVDAKFQVFQIFRNFWIGNFYFKMLHIIEKMSDFDG